MRVKDILLSDVYKKPANFGLDISDFSIKIIQLEKKGKEFELKSFNRTPIPKGIIEEVEIKKEKELIEIIKKSIREVKGKSIKTPYVVCSFPEQEAFVKVIQLPKMKLEEAKEAIKWEAEANIPLSLEEVYLDWKIITSSKTNSHLDILINAAPRSLVDKYLEALQAADLEPIVFEIESIATARSLIGKEINPEPVLIIDLGFNRTSFIIFDEQNIRFTSSIPLSNQKIITDIAKKLEISQEKAQSLKFKTGLNKEKDKNLFEALVPSINELIKQVEDCNVFYKENMSEIILCGGGAYLKGLPQYLSDQLKIPVSLGNPWLNICSNPDKKFKDSLAYSTALGLALRGIQQ